MPPNNVEIRPAYTLRDIVEALKKPEVQADLDKRLKAIDEVAKRAVFEVAEELEGARDILLEVIAGTDEGESMVNTFIGDFLGLERGDGG
jgi:hypothetical protein